MFYRKEAREVIRRLPEGGILSNLQRRRNTYAVIANFNQEPRHVITTHKEVKAFARDYDQRMHDRKVAQAARDLLLAALEADRA